MTEQDDIARLYSELNELRIQVNDMKVEAQEREVKRLRIGVTALGAIILSVGGWAWAQISDLVSLNVGGPR